MIDRVTAIRLHTDRQVVHWALAASRLTLDDLAAPEAWNRLEQYLGMSLRKHLSGVIERLQREAEALVALQRAAYSITALADLRCRLLAFRRQFLRTETTLDYFADAINTRTNTKMAALLRACDTLAQRSMTQLLDQLGKSTPPTLTYLDKGLGASILKAGMRLWDAGEVCPVAAIKVTRHNILRPTALIHEAGHQVAHITGWNDELAAALREGLASAPGEVASEWSSWSSEIAADAFAFVHTGYGSVAALHDVVAGEEALVFRHSPGDPHPISFLRVLLGVEMCRYFYGDGPWDGLADAWTAIHPVESSPSDVRQLLQDSVPVLGKVVRLTLDTPMAAFAGRPLRALIAPERVSPTALAELEERVGPALITSAHWLWSEPLRILGLTGLALATRISSKGHLDQEHAMLRLGGMQEAA